MERSAISREPLAASMASSLQPEQKQTLVQEREYPDNPVLVEVWRGDEVESQHRGSWVMCDTSGRAIEGVGTWDHPVFTRSAVKSLQALPLLETGAAQRFQYSDAEVALALASHNGEVMHTRAVLGVLKRLALPVEALQCGAQPPADPEAEELLRRGNEPPSALHNNCSGKHAGFLALAVHLGVPVQSYLDPESQVQRLVHKAVLDMTGLSLDEIGTAIDGCSAPTFRMPLSGLATAFARMANPHGLAPLRRAACERMTAAVAAHPDMIAGRYRRICTDLARVTRGRIFPKIGSEAVYALGLCGLDRGLAVKIDDGSTRGLHALIVDLLRRFRFARSDELKALEAWESKCIRNWAGLEVGRTQVVA